MSECGRISGTTASAHVLVVDDVATNREIVSTVLRAAGHRVDVSESGEDALGLVRANAYDVILMDVQMPRFDGLMATRAIRAFDGEVAHTPIVALTANVFEEQIRSFLGAGMDDHVGKPFRFNDLRETVVRWCGRRSPAAAPGADGPRPGDAS